MAIMKDFAESAKSLTKNPLGVIGLFLVLVYGFASLVIGVSGSKLEPSERLPLIWFLVLFPVLVLAAFYRLVTRHHKKLYAPSDYQDEKLFFQPLGEEEKEKKVGEELDTIEAAVSLISQTGVAQQQFPRTELQSRYIEAERLSFLAIKEKLGRPVEKHVSVQSHGRSFAFDGLLLTESQARLIEIKYFSRPLFKKEFLEAPLYRASSFLYGQMFDKGKEDIAFLFVIIMDFPREDTENFVSKIKQAVVSDLFKVEVLFFRYDELEAKYGRRVS